MSKIGIITIVDNNNCGNRLQNYALQEILKKLGNDVYTLKNETFLNWNEKYYVGKLRFLNKRIKSIYKINKFFKEFNKNINFSNKYITIKSKNISNNYDYFIAGSDQVWKPTRRRLSKIDLLGFAEPNKRISYAASFGLEKIDKKYYKTLQEELPKFKAISVREDAGREIIKDATGINNVSVVLDPTLLLDRNEWIKLEKKPAALTEKKYIFTYFLGDENIIELVSKIFCKDYSIVDFYKGKYGPSEFLYLINHAEYILTDSFHGTVFSILFGKEFFVFNRKQEDLNNNMNSRLDTLLGKFSLKDRKINDLDKINKEYKINYKYVEEKLNDERKKSLDFLSTALKYKIK